MRGRREGRRQKKEQKCVSERGRLERKGRGRGRGRGEGEEGERERKERARKGKEIQGREERDKGRGRGKRQCVCVCASHGEVVPEQLHDESAVLVGVLLQLVQLSNGVIESLNRRERKL